MDCAKAGGSRWRSVFAAATLAACVLAAVACDDASGGEDGHATPTAASQPLADNLPVVMSARLVCRLAADSPDALAAQITGVDGTQSALASGTAYWFFGDTVRRSATGQDVIPASVATTDDADASDCLDLRFKQRDGMAEPLFPRLGETTAWPDGVLPLDDGSILFYMVKAYRQSPFAWHVGSVGLGRVEPGSLEGTRLVETIWDEHSGFGSRISGAGSVIRDGDDLLVYLRTDDGRVLLARAPIVRAGEREAYTYWTGGDWSANASESMPIWESQPDGVLPADNGVHVTYDERLGTWLAIYNASLARVDARTADAPWGPWSAPLPWFDCQPLVMDRYPYCYSAQLHRHLSRDDGATIYLTFSSQQPYDVALMEVRMGEAVHTWLDGDGRSRYAFASPGEGWRDGGVAFYASSAAAQGLSPVYEIAGHDGYTYGLDASPGTQPVFYAYSTAQATPITTVAVAAARGNSGGLTAGDGRGKPLFYVPCAGTPADTPGCE